MTTDRRKKGFPVVLTVLAVIAFVVLCGLGVWQVQRLLWKQELMAKVEAALAAAPQPIGPVLTRAKAGGDVDFVRVTAPCAFISRPPYAPVYSIRDGEAGLRPMAYCILPDMAYRSVLVDLGFRPGTEEPLRPAMGGGEITVTGILRTPEPPNSFTPRGKVWEGEIFYWRDLPAITRFLGASETAPVYLMLETPAPSAGVVAAPLPNGLSNRHLGYAITWFGLAAALVAVYAAVLIRRRRS